MLARKTALVTGSSKGIGRAIAETFGREGADVAVNYHSDEVGGRTAAETVRDEGVDAIAVGADISKPDEAVRLVERTRDELGTIDILVNNAGIFPRESWEQMSRDKWDSVMDVNLGGLFNVSKQILPAMAERGDGAIVNMSSTWGLQGGTVDAAYTATKGGIIAITRQMCHAYASDGVRINAITPGAVKTEMNADLRKDDDYVRDVMESVPAGRFGDPTDVANVAAFLASPMAAYIHGENIVVDGGITA